MELLLYQGDGGETEQTNLHVWVEQAQAGNYLLSFDSLEIGY
jgi:hypothetical protein